MAIFGSLFLYFCGGPPLCCWLFGLGQAQGGSMEANLSCSTSSGQVASKGDLLLWVFSM